ncbi:MAG: crotonase/enoyl-CoA hydratase family protein [Gammaproteobacteria bacterium]
MTTLAHLQRDKQLALLTLDDGKANAFSHAMIERLHNLLDEVEADESVRALVITGREGRFSAGFDLSVMKAGPEAVRGLVGAGACLALRIHEFPKPVVMACSGHALAMGAILLFTADWRTGADGDFKIGMNEVQIGMIMPQFGAELARDRLSPRYYSRAVLNAEIFTPSVAVDAGYLDEVVDELSVIDFACVQAERLAALDPRAFAATKRRTRAATLRLIREGLAADLEGLSGL